MLVEIKSRKVKICETVSGVEVVRILLCTVRKSLYLVAKTSLIRLMSFALESWRRDSRNVEAGGGGK